MELNVMKNLPFFLSLTTDSFQVIKGDFSQEGLKIESFASVKPPLDIFQQGKISQPQAAGEIITALLANSRPRKIKSNFCCLSLAEEFVFSKFLSLPRVKEKELEAAIYFKIKDFLPHNPEAMYLDWQVLTNGGHSFEVNVVGVKREIIDSYLEVFKMIDIFPLAFEPESCSLARLARLTSPETNLAVYFNDRKAVFCFEEKGMVLLTTTLNFPPGQREERIFLEELAKSAKFWQTTFGEKKKIKNVFLAGFIQNELVLQQIVKDNFGVEVKKLSLPVIVPAGFSPKNMSKLIPLCGLAFSQRIDDKTKKITLLPEKVKEKRESFKFQGRAKAILKTTSLLLSGFLAVYLLVFLSIFFQLEKTKAALSGWEKIVFTPRQSQLEKEAVNLNQKLVSLNQALKNKKEVSPLLLNFIKQIPVGIMITEFNFDSAKKVIELKGIADSRENILTLEKSLAKLGSVAIPLSSFEEMERPKFSAVIKLE
jgi:Tfp pilus assembly PilM family ATPase/Tfp pilus assembly protein PilN